ncbi:MAG: hypothetical protein PHC90_14325 [Syntrophorhabdaceae bacterium]|nr:hypothetical protein [Syntrophorhabdaceae bacterium]
MNSLGTRDKRITAGSWSCPGIWPPSHPLVDAREEIIIHEDILSVIPPAGDMIDGVLVLNP